MKTNIVKIGNSQGIRIPKVLLEQSRLGTEVELEVLALHLAAETDALDLEVLHEAFRDTGDGVGDERASEAVLGPFGAAVARPADVHDTGLDLDAEPDAASLRFLTGRQSLDGLSVCYRNTWDAVHPAAPGGTFVASNPVAPDHWPFERIDHILIRCGEHGGPTLRIEGCELAFAEPVDGVWASNHLGLVADFASDSSSGPLDSP